MKPFNCFLKKQHIDKKRTQQHMVAPFVSTIDLRPSCSYESPGLASR